MPTIGPGGGYLNTSVTFGEGKARVARVLQGSSQPEVLTQAGDALHDAIRWWNRRDWRALLATAPTQSVSADVSEYDVPANLKKIYGVRLAARPLYYATQRDWDRNVWDQSGTTTPTHYMLFNLGQQRKIKLIPVPSEADTLTVNYYQAIPLPTQEDTPLGIPDPWVEPIINYAKALVCADRRDPRSTFFMGLAQKGFGECKMDDLYQPDEEVGLKVAGGGYGPGSSWYYVRQRYGF